MSGFDTSTSDPGMMPMNISDAASMLRRAVQPNERPYIKTMILNNNAIVDEWYEKILKEIANKAGQIRTGQVWGEWEFFYYGKIVPQFMAQMEAGHICRPTETAIDFWVKAFTTKSIKELAKMGPAVVGHGWKLVADETFIRGCLAKWEHVYSRSEDPLVWRKLAHENPKLWNADHENPFWGPEELGDVTQKVMSVLKIGISPQ